MRDKKESGPVEDLCKEIGAIFTPEMESTKVFVAFVSVIVSEVEDMMETATAIAHLTDKKVSGPAEDALAKVKKMLTIKGDNSLIDEAREIGLSLGEPNDHFIDMLSSCNSAIWFGLEKPCRSRHAASAANHVWKRRYGISLFDKHSGQWGRMWISDKFYEALGNLSVD